MQFSLSSTNGYCCRQNTFYGVDQVGGPAATIRRRTAGLLARFNISKNLCVNDPQTLSLFRIALLEKVMTVWLIGKGFKPSPIAPGSAMREFNWKVKKMETRGDETGDTVPVKSLVVVFSYHHKNTEKVAHVIAKVLDAPVTTPQQVNPEEIGDYQMVGFGSGIYGAKHHKSLLDLVDKLPQADNRKAFIFSTCGVPPILYDGERFREFVLQNHTSLREKLQSKGYTIIDEFGCRGFNTNSFLAFFGGLNKGRPNAEDLMNAEEFARSVIEKARAK